MNLFVNDGEHYILKDYNIKVFVFSKANGKGYYYQIRDMEEEERSNIHRYWFYPLNKFKIVNDFNHFVLINWIKVFQKGLQ